MAVITQVCARVDNDTADDATQKRRAMDADDEGTGAGEGDAI